MTAHPLWHATLVLDPTATHSIQQQLVQHFRQLIHDGIWPPGQVLPSSRTVAIQCQINRKTVSRAYAQLAAQGLIYTRPKHGTYVSMLALTRLHKSAPLAIDDAHAQSASEAATKPAHDASTQTTSTATETALQSRLLHCYQTLFNRLDPHTAHTAEWQPHTLGPLAIRLALVDLLKEERQFVTRVEQLACGSESRLMQALVDSLPAQAVVLADSTLTGHQATRLSQQGHTIIRLPIVARGQFAVLVEQLEKYAINYPLNTLWCDSEYWLSGRHRHTELAVLAQKLADYKLQLIDDQRRRLPDWQGHTPLAAHYKQSLLLASLYGTHCDALNLCWIASQTAFSRAWLKSLQRLGPVTANMAMLAHHALLTQADYRPLLLPSANTLSANG